MYIGESKNDDGYEKSAGLISCKGVVNRVHGWVTGPWPEQGQDQTTRWQLVLVSPYIDAAIDRFHNRTRPSVLCKPSGTGQSGHRMRVALVSRIQARLDHSFLTVIPCTVALLSSLQGWDAGQLGHSRVQLFLVNSARLRTGNRYNFNL